jgi:DNA polymerase-1
MQNVSKEVKAGARYTVAARRCFRARPGCFLLLADYAGIEMRLGVQGTRSERLIQLCRDNFDFHSACAAAFYGDKFTKEQDPKVKKALRNRAKNARFAMFYGAGIYQTSKTLGLTMEEVEEGFNRDKREYPEFYELMAWCTEQARRTGGIHTFFGRFLRVEADRPYSATDYLIQGSAAALFKHAQVACRDYRMLIPVHDELVFEFPRKDLERLPEITKRINALMTEFKEITVPIKVEFAVSPFTWDQKKDYAPEH